MRTMFIKFGLSGLRLIRLTIFLALAISLSIFFIHYKKSLSMKNRLKLKDKEERGVSQMEELFIELEVVTIGNLDLVHRYKNIKSQHGDEHDESQNREDPKKLLESIFDRADNDKNEYLDIQELAKWIHTKITDHINRAMRENIGLFTTIDVDPRNGEVSWAEYHAHFLRSHGFSENYINSHSKRHKEMSRALKEIIMRDRARWTEAAKNDPDKLTLDEFLAFTHPESSHRSLLQMVEDLFEKFDRDGDEQLTEDEFVDLPSDGLGLDLREDRHEAIGGSEERRKEFRYLIDKNKNGQADRSELLMYMDPRNPRHAIQEAQQLITLSDVNQDGKLDLPEIYSKMDLFLGSKVVDAEKSFHDEFR